jgi:hypothetical protein
MLISLKDSSSPEQTRSAIPDGIALGRPDSGRDASRWAETPRCQEVYR